ncbi:uncharacterized protein METZ01_LOCUS311735, partial [marine metagenome]
VYLRGAGFFSSSVFEAIGSSLGDFVERGGRMRLVMNVRMTQEDQGAVTNGMENWDTIVENEISRIVKDEFNAPIGRGSLMLTRLLEMGRLEIRIAKKPEGIYHEKIGIFFDGEDIDIDGGYDDLCKHDHLTFFGSVNESKTAWYKSHENIKTHWSWSEDGRSLDANETLKDFIDNWTDETPGLEVHSFPEAAKKGLLQIASETEHMIQMGLIQQPSVTRKVWIEKTKVAGRKDREVGDRSLGRAIWSPQRGKPPKGKEHQEGADIYAEM